VQPKVVCWSIFLIAMTAASANAQWLPFPYPGPVIGYPQPGYYQGRSFANVRTQVTPKNTQVFVDGYSAGIVDDFDGVFQRLQLVPGQHEITLYLPGYRTYRENVYLNPGSSHHIRYTMTPRPAGEPDEAMPVPLVPPMMAGRGMPPPRPAGSLPPIGARLGTLSLSIEPGDANVLIDGEAWRGPQSQNRFSAPLAEGHHHLQIDKSGFEPFSVDVDIRAGETTSLNVTLNSK
jgi:hypothetical protein